MLVEKTDEAKSDFDKAVELQPNFGIAFVQKCYADYRHSVKQRDMNLIQESIENFKNACTTFPDCVECFNMYAQVIYNKICKLIFFFYNLVSSLNFLLIFFQSGVGRYK